MELEKIKEFTAGIMSADISEINENTRFVKDLGMDSLDILQLVIEIEAFFEVDIADSMIASIKTVGDAASMLRMLA